jgi:hypothetical protein
MLVHNRLASMRFTYEEMHSPMPGSAAASGPSCCFWTWCSEGQLLLLDEPTRNFSPLSAPVVRAA